MIYNIESISGSLQSKAAKKPSLMSIPRKQASVFMLITNDPDPEILFILKADNPGYPWRNQPAFPGGHVDQSETNLEAAFREIEEELSIPSVDVEHIASLGFYETINRTVLEAFAGRWNGLSSIKHDSSEISRVVMVKVSDLIKLHMQKNFGGREPDLYELIYDINGIEVWGVTARVVHRFLEIITNTPDHASFLSNS